MRAPQDEHLETLFSIGSKQRQHVLAIVSACLIYDSAENCRMKLNIKFAADHKVQFPRDFGRQRFEARQFEPYPVTGNKFVRPICAKSLRRQIMELDRFGGAAFLTERRPIKIDAFTFFPALLWCLAGAG